MLLVIPPPAALRRYISFLGYAEEPLGYAREKVLPTGGSQLLVNLDSDEIRTYHPTPAGYRVERHGGAVLQGPYDRPSVIDTASQRAVALVAFRPGGAYPFFGLPLGETRAALVDLVELWGRDGAVLRERMLHATGPGARLAVLRDALLERFARPGHPALGAAAAALERGGQVGAAADQLGISERHLGRLFTEQLGLTPKRFSRVRRFQRLLGSVASGAGDPDSGQLNPSRPGPGQPGPGQPWQAGSDRRAGHAGAVDWARLAAECGYYDQAHLIHDFRQLAGMPPSAYRPRSPGERNHVPLG